MYNPMVKVNFHTKNQGHRSNDLGRRVQTLTHGSNSMSSTADMREVMNRGACRAKMHLKIFDIIMPCKDWQAGSANPSFGMTPT